MRTLLSRFCEEFEGVARPLLDPLDRAAESLHTASRSLPARSALPRLRDLHHQLHNLAEKVAGQQAYVLIFGPLKSGKSTLMNAMSSAYVSEVTSLPAYPCMVFVSHAPERRYRVTRYNGETEEFSDLNAMRVLLNRAHAELAERIRKVEREGLSFDPALHFPEAIRRIDLRLDAPELAQSGAVLVDTPGLYSKMKFGYDRMTREFRDTAACAIFVVKTDNLFLEQVFEEFHELLELFSRIFLVVNLDSTKKDLRPDGSLAPSLEHEEPLRIIEAFEKLSMSEPLKTAAEEGRLRIYPVDLLRAASARLRRARGAEAEEEAERRAVDFESFLGDLTDYLNSNDYLVAFLGDSLRHLGHLLDEAERICGLQELQGIEEEVQGLKRRQEAGRRQAEILDRLLRFHWEEATRPLLDELLAAGRDTLEGLRERGWQAVHGALALWFKNDRSLQELLTEDLGPVLASLQNELALAIHRALREGAGREDAGAVLPQGVRTSLVAAGLPLQEISAGALDGVDPYAGIEEQILGLDPADVPVRKGFWDWILFRGQGAVRRRLFGPSQRPAQRIPRSAKQRRLGEAGREAMERQLEESLEALLPEILDRLAGRIYSDYASQLVASLRTDLEGRSEENQRQLLEVEGRLLELGRIQERLAELRLGLERGRQAWRELRARYHGTAPEALRQPLPEEGAGAGDRAVEAGDPEPSVEAGGQEPPETPTREQEALPRSPETGRNDL